MWLVIELMSHSRLITDNSIHHSSHKGMQEHKSPTFTYHTFTFHTFTYHTFTYQYIHLSHPPTPSQWSEVQDYITRPSDKPVVLNRSSSTNSSNPFGSTYCYGYRNLIFEVGVKLNTSAPTFQMTFPSLLFGCGMRA